ncbi:MAG TPA: 3-hydroxyacyl-CoA dehydrogenase NAD-binding domain-containing protein [Streptosporangiaceae bacterium]|nr:3-hydroxyacyl-CoA dehydrogenase NAD-binding domain-containing protein [Streptosporangiaceae bacterium]
MKRVAIIGTGTMGPGMAATLARGGLDIGCFDTLEAARDRVPGEVETAFAVLDRIGGPEAAERGTVTVHDDLGAAVGDSDLVIEAVPENAEIKAKVFADLDRLAPASAILASNTSGIPITKLGESVADPSRVVGMHWSNPPHVIPVIEVIAGARTSPAVVELLRDTITGLGLVAVRVQRDVPGFVENRVLYAIMRECLALVDDGVISAEELDTCVKWGIGFKLAVIPPLQLLDVAGLDIYNAVGSYLNQDLNARRDVSETITSRVQRGELGMKTGSGLFSYTPEQAQSLRQERAARLVAVRKALS